jgi:hypothetical protein
VVNGTLPAASLPREVLAKVRKGHTTCAATATDQGETETADQLLAEGRDT